MTAKKSQEILGCIYLLTNLTNGKRYVGQYKNAKFVERRWSRHIVVAFNMNDPRPLYRAMRKAWRESKGQTIGFSADVIWTGAVEKLHNKEVHYIKKLHSFNCDPLGDKSYNLTKGGDGAQGYVHSKATKKKMSASALRRFEKPGAREKNRRAQQLQAAQPGESERRSAVRSTSEYRVKASAALKRYYASLTKQERNALAKTLSVAQLKRWSSATPKQRKKWIDAHNDGCRTPEARTNYATSATKRWSSMSVKARNALTAAIKAGRQTPQAKVNASKGVKRAWQSKTAKERITWIKAISKGNRTPQARAKSSDSTIRFWNTMTPEERKAYYHATHPNGNGR